MSETDPRELDDLQQLVASDGFKRFEAYLDQEWGDAAQVRKIDNALRELKPGDFDAEHMTVSQIRASAIHAQRLGRWPHSRIDQLKGAKSKSMNPMDALRRIAR